VHHHNLFNDKAELYESSRPIYPQEISSYLARLCPSNELAWDSACGNGQAAIGLIQEFNSVYATDVSKEQISNAKHHPQIAYEVSPSEKVNLENESCDLICVAQALHWFDYNLFWPEAQRVLKPNGIFCAFGYNRASISPEIDRVIESSLMKIIEPFWAQQNKLLWNHYRDIAITFEIIDPPNFMMEVNWNLNEYFNYLHTSSATRRCMNSIGNEFFYKAYEEVGYLWGSSEKSNKIALDFVFYAGHKIT
jgi:ubiquinone/menaquinone biosynthesis C-methylase UbiE